MSTYDGQFTIAQAIWYSCKLSQLNINIALTWLWTYFWRMLEWLLYHLLQTVPGLVILSAAVCFPVGMKVILEWIWILDKMQRSSCASSLQSSVAATFQIEGTLWPTPKKCWFREDCKLLEVTLCLICSQLWLIRHLQNSEFLYKLT